MTDPITTNIVFFDSVPDDKVAVNLVLVDFNTDACVPAYTVVNNSVQVNIVVIYPILADSVPADPVPANTFSSDPIT